MTILDIDLVNGKETIQSCLLINENGLIYIHLTKIEKGSIIDLVR